MDDCAVHKLRAFSPDSSRSSNVLKGIAMNIQRIGNRQLGDWQASLVAVAVLADNKQQGHQRA